jgi:hypothetical protein
MASLQQDKQVHTLLSKFNNLLDVGFMKTKLLLDIEYLKLTNHLTADFLGNCSFLDEQFLLMESSALHNTKEFQEKNNKFNLVSDLYSKYLTFFEHNKEEIRMNLGHKDQTLTPFLHQKKLRNDSLKKIKTEVKLPEKIKVLQNRISSNQENKNMLINGKSKSSKEENLEISLSLIEDDVFNNSYESKSNQPFKISKESKELKKVNCCKTISFNEDHNSLEKPDLYNSRSTIHSSKQYERMKKAKFNERFDCLRKRFKAMANSYIVKRINFSLINEGKDVFIMKLPRYFTVDVKVVSNKHFFDKTVGYIFSADVKDRTESIKVMHNRKIINKIKNIDFQRILETRILDIYLEYLNSAEFKEDSLRIIKKHGENYYQIFVDEIQKFISNFK